MGLRKIGRQRLSDAVVEELIRLLERGEWKPGEKLPREAELASRLGVSRNTLREALYSLTLAGILEQRQGAGTFVRGGPPGRVPCFSLPPRGGARRNARHPRGGERPGCSRDLPLGPPERAAPALHRHGRGSAHRGSGGLSPAGCRLPPNAGRGRREPLHGASAEHRPRPDRAAGYRGRPPAAGARARCQDDHERLLEAVVAGDPRASVAAMARHMARVREAIGAPPEKEPACRPMPRLSCSRSETVGGGARAAGRGRERRDPLLVHGSPGARAPRTGHGGSKPTARLPPHARKRFDPGGTVIHEEEGMIR